MRSCSYLSSAALAALLLLGTSGPASAQTFTMKIGTATINDVQHEWLKRYAARVEKRAGGRIKVEGYPAGQLGSIPRMIEGVQLGTLECWVGPPEFLVGHEAGFQAVGASGIFQDMAHAYRTAGDPKFREPLLALGLSRQMKGVSLFIYGQTAFASRKPIRKLDDFKGQKIRVFASPMQTVPLGKLGATGVPMPLGELLPALQQGAVDGVRTGITIFTTFKYYDIIKYVTETHESIIMSMSIVSKSWYDRLPPDLQKVVMEEGEAVQKELFDYMVDQNNKSRELWKEKGGELIKLSAPDQAELLKRVSAATDEVAAGLPKVKEVYDLLVERAKANR